MKATFLLRMEPELKHKLQAIAEAEKRSITSLILLIVEEKLRGAENGN